MKSKHIFHVNVARYRTSLQTTTRRNLFVPFVSHIESLSGILAENMARQTTLPAVNMFVLKILYTETEKFAMLTG